MQGMLKKEEEEEKEFNVEKFAKTIEQTEQDFIQELGVKTKSKRTSKSPKRTDMQVKKEEGQVQENGDIIFDFTQKKKIQVRSFKKEILVDLREFYTDNQGEERPTKKGFCFTVQQWENFKDMIPLIDEAVQKKQKK